MSRAPLLTLVAAALLGAPVQAAPLGVSKAGGPSRARSGEVLVALADPSALALDAGGRVSPRDAGLQAVLARHGLGRYAALGASGDGRGSRFLTLQSDRAGFDPFAAARELAATGAFRAVSPNLMLRLYATVPNDPYIDPFYQWYVNSTAGVRLPEAWDLGKGDTSTVIAVMDNGLDIGHPDLASQVWINRAEIPGNGVDDDGNGYVDDVKGWDFGNHDNDPSSEPAFDPSGIDIGFHGTFVAGVADAATNNAVGIAGSGWGCRFMALKVGDSAGDIPLSAVTEAFGYVASKGAAALNMSFGTPDTTARAYFQALVDDATAAGIVCVSAAGNDGTETRSFPAACDNVLAVGATNESGTRASFSNWGAWVDVAAPGQAMWSSICRNYTFDFLSQIIYLLYFGWDGENPYMYGDGTSFASPLVAGVVGMVRAKMPSLPPQAVIQHIIATGDAVAYDHPIGPRVNAFRALNEPVLAVEPLAPPLASLGAAWPNPFEISTTIAFTLGEAGPVRLRIYDTGGRAARELIAATFPAGRHAVLWDGRGADGRPLGSGVYFAVLLRGGVVSVRKLVLSR